MKASTTGFEHEYQRLNSAQKSAVDLLDGPVLTIAGPGTGKTQIIAGRIAHILLKTDAQPENILCLTYTDAGTIAMRNRLFQFIGPDAYRVHIHTFHAFCNKVIQENTDYFGVRALDAVSDLERKTWVRDIIDHLPRQNPLKRFGADAYFEVDRLLDLYQTMKREDWMPAFMHEKCDAYVASLADKEIYRYKKDSKYGKKGDLKPDYHEEVKRIGLLKAGIDTFETYQEKLRANNRYDFADMILWVIRAFRTSQTLLLNYQEKFQYFLVDEYQDTSGSQNHLLTLLIDYWERPNIFCVGDDDQSIFRFQGANIENIQHFVKTYQPALISLTDNYRSSATILHSAGALIQHNQKRLDENKQLSAVNPEVGGLQTLPAIWTCHNELHESSAVAEEIRKLLASGVKGNEIAVLYSKHKYADDLLQWFQSNQIPVNTRRSENILENLLVKKIIQILKYIAAEHQKPHSGEAYLYPVLHNDFFGIDTLTLAKISVDLYRRNFNERQSSWREEIRKSGKPDLFHQDENRNPLYRASVLIEGWISASFNETLQQLVERVLNESGMLLTALTSPDKNWNMQVLHTFFDFIKDECLKHPGLTLAQLVETLSLMDEVSVSLPSERLLFAENGVNFISAHSSKGLEFDYVFIIGCNSNKWEKARSGNTTFKLPDNLFEISEWNETEEIRRLFYVATTRARRQLIWSWAAYDEQGKELEKCRFLAEIEAGSDTEQVTKIQGDDDLLGFERAIRSRLPQQQAENLFDNQLADELLKDYSLSVTHLNNYLKCPTAFYFGNLIRVPSPMSPYATFGSAVHYALEQLFKKMNADAGKKFPEPDEMQADFRWYMKRNRDAFTDAGYKRQLEYGEECLQKFYDRYLKEWNKITSIERTYRNVVMEGIPLNGKLDKLEFDGKQVNVVDYKTGKYSKSGKKFKKPDIEKAKGSKEPSFEAMYGGDYWRQAVFYKLLLDHDPSTDWQVRSVEFDFVEPDRDSGEFFKERINITPEDEQEVKAQIHRAFEGIKQKIFSPGCGKENCIWCTFISDYRSGKAQNLHLSGLEEDENG